MKILTLEKLSKIIPTNKNPTVWFDALSKYLDAYEINTERRIAAFLTQCAHESNDFRVLSENLNYSRKGLLITFSKYFNETTAAQYARQPEKIANLVYANRMDNGNEKSGDGYKYRGRGLIQTTGKRNYTLLSRAIYGNDRIVLTPDLLAQPKDALISACWFWNTNNLNRLADNNEIIKITKIINGVKNGLEDRAIRFADATNILYS